MPKQEGGVYRGRPVGTEPITGKGLGEVSFTSASKPSLDIAHPEAAGAQGALILIHLG